ncbi:MAG TPA: polysaccharide biosynthesis C-terminal domain-containing protein [Mycobacteriales bacterium]
MTGWGVISRHPDTSDPEATARLNRFDPEATVQLDTSDPEATVWLGLARPPAGTQPPGPDQARGPDQAPGADQPPGTEPGRDSLQAVARGGSVNLVGAAVTTVANLLLSVVVARAVSTADAGIFFSLTSLLLLLATLGRLGTNGGAVYFLPRLRVLGSAAEIDRAVRLSVRPTLLASGVLGLGLLAFAPQLADRFVGGASDDAVLVLRLCGLALPFAAVGDVLQAVTRGFGRMRTTVVIERIARPLAQVVLIGLAAPTHQVALLVLAWTLPYLPAALLSWLPARRLLAAARASKAGAAPSGFDRRQYWWFTAPRALTLLAQVALQRLDVVLVVSILGPAPAALYAAATRFLVVGQLGNQAISIALQPRLSAALARDDKQDAGLLYRTTTGWLVLTTWPLYLLVGAFPSALLGIFGSRYASATDVVVVLCAAMLVATACGQVDIVLMMAGRSTWNLGNALLALAVQVGLDLLLIPRMGILGAATGWAVAIVVANLVPLTQLLLSTGLHPFGRSSGLAVLICTACVLPPAALARVLGGDHLVWALVASVVAAGLWAAAIWRFRRPLRLDSFGALSRRKPPPALPDTPEDRPEAPPTAKRATRKGRGRHRR